MTLAAVDLRTQPRRRAHRRVLAGAVLVALLAAIWQQRSTVDAAFSEAAGLSGLALAGLIALALADRIGRAVAMRRAVGTLTRVEGFVLHDVGAAASYGLPAGGVVGTGMRYHVARRAGVESADFLVGVTAFSVAMSAASWLLPAGVLSVEIGLGRASALDVGLLTLSLAMLTGTALLWWVLLKSTRLFERLVTAVEAIRRRAETRVARLRTIDTRTELLELRIRMRASLPRLPVLIISAVVIQLVAAAVLLAALVGVGVGPELALLEFARVFFVARVLSALAPTPGGVGVVEAGLTAALVSAGVETSTAIAGVLIYRLLTYVVPIVTGTICWLCWRAVSSRGTQPVPPVPHADSATR